MDIIHSNITLFSCQLFFESLFFESYNNNKNQQINLLKEGCKYITLKNLIYHLGNFLFEYKYLRRYGGLAYINPYKKLGKVTELLS